MKARRTVELDYDARREPKTKRFCIKCQKDIGPYQPARIIRTVPGEPLMVHPDDALPTDETWLVGLDCARKIGMEYSVPEPTPAKGEK